MQKLSVRDHDVYHNLFLISGLSPGFGRAVKSFVWCIILRRQVDSSADTSDERILFFDPWARNSLLIIEGLLHYEVNY
jgi:hypothetical protein